MLKIEKKSNSTTTTVDVDYTVTSRLIPSNDDVDLNSMFFNYMINDECIVNNGNSSYPTYMYMNNIFSRTPLPFKYGSIVLRDSRKQREIDIMSYFASSNRVDATDIVGRADLYSQSSSTNKQVGTLNESESSTTKLNQNIINFKRVVDFGTDRINDIEFDEILLMPCGFNNGVTNELVGMTTQYTSPTSHKMLMKKPKIFNKYNNSTSIPRYAVDTNDNMMLLNPDGTFIYCENGIAAQVDTSSIDISRFKNGVIAFINGKFTIFSNGVYGGGGVSNTAKSSYYIIENIQYNNKTHKYNINVSDPHSLPVVSSSYIDGTYFIPLVWEWNGYVYAIIQRYSTSISHVNIIKMDIEMTTILDSFTSYATGIISTGGSGAYYPVGLIYDPNKDTVIIHKYGGKLIELSKDLTYVQHEFGFPTTYSELLYRFPHNSKLWGSIRGDLPYNVDGDFTKMYVYGEVNTLWNSIMKIKLNEPISKSSSETLKIILDVTVNNGNIDV